MKVPLPSDGLPPSEAKPRASTGRLNKADIKEVDSLRLGRYPFRGGIGPYIESRKGTWNQKTTAKEERRKLEQIGRTFEELKAQGRVSTTDPRRITRSDVQEFMIELRKVDPTFQGKQMGRLKLYLRFYKNHVIDDMKDAGVRVPRAHKKPIRAIEQGELNLIFRTAKDMGGWTGAMSRGMLSLYFATGLRPSELRMAHFEDLNLKKRTLYVRHPKGEGNWASPETVDLLREDMVPFIERYIRERAEHLRAEGAGDMPALFPNLLSETGFYSANRFNMIKRKVEELSGVDFKLKDFRSTLTTMTVNGDQSRMIGMTAQLRHIDPNTTPKYYNNIQRGVASKKLRDVWKESAVNVSDTPSIDNRYGTSGYG
jgi:integrase